ncbi:hypothetical protein SAMN05428998_13170, partial [Tistlia consotensis USBA 355]
IGMKVPVERYQPSRRALPERLPAIEYEPEDVVRWVDQNGWISYRGRRRKIGKAFRGTPVALRPTQIDGRLDIFFCHQKLASLDLTEQTELKPVHNVPERVSTMSPV